VNKPAAFANYRYRKELFPALIFTKAYDSLQQWYSPINADKEYLRRRIVAEKYQTITSDLDIVHL
jgi:hypothetical protein